MGEASANKQGSHQQPKGGSPASDQQHNFPPSGAEKENFLVTI